MNRGAQLRTARIARGLSQHRLAELAGVSVRTIRSIERDTTGSPHRHSLERVAGALQLTAAQTADFVALWASVSSTSKIAPVVGRTLDVDAYLATGNRPLNEGTRVVSSAAHMFMAAGLSTHSEWNLLLEARTRPVTGFRAEDNCGTREGRPRTWIVDGSSSAEPWPGRRMTTARRDGRRRAGRRPA